MNTILYFLEIVGISLFVSLAISGFVNYFEKPIFASDCNNRIRCQLMVFGDGCDVSRYRVHCPVYQPVVDVLNADRLRIGNYFEPQVAIYL